MGQISTGPFVLLCLSALKHPLETCPSLAQPWLGHSSQRTAPTSFHSCAKLCSAGAPSSSHPPTLLLLLGEGPAALQYLCWADGPPSMQQPAGDLEAAHPSWPCYEWEKWKSSGGELPMAESLRVAHVINDSVLLVTLMLCRFWTERSRAKASLDYQSEVSLQQYTAHPVLIPSQ